MNLVKQLGGLAFGTRLRLLTDRFIQEGAKVYKMQNIDFEPRWFTLFYLLSQKSPLSISEITNELGYTQPAVTQIANIMVKKGLLKVVKDKTDTRKRMLTLSQKGQELLPKLKPIWRGFENAISELFNETGFDMPAVMGKLESALDKKELSARVNEKITQTNPEAEIITYNPEYKIRFRDLNYEWLEKYFSIEEEDWKILNNPEEEIIGKGGEIFFAKLYDEVAGTAALIKHGEGKFELAKMAVTDKAQGRQLGKMLAEAVISKAKQNGADRLYLETNSGLTKAMNLYRKLGFKETPFNNVSKYARSTVKMELMLK